MQARLIEVTFNVSTGLMFPQVASPGNRVAQGKYHISGCLRDYYLLSLAMLMVKDAIL